MKKHALIFGYGYVAQHLTKTLITLGYKVYGTTRDLSQFDTTESPDFKLIAFDDKSTITNLLGSVDVVLSTIPPNDDQNDPVLEEYQAILLQKNTIKWVGYLSTTGVYGDHNGEWVYEASECKPQHERTKTRLAIEKKWLALASEQKLPVHIFRLSGIYGPGRNILKKLVTGKTNTLVKAEHFFSRTHVADICLALSASIQQPSAGEIYNVSDNEPAPLHVVEQFGASLLNKTPLVETPYDMADISPMMQSFFTANRRVNSTKICKQLGFTWQYPNYRVGLEKGCLPYLEGEKA